MKPLKALLNFRVELLTGGLIWIPHFEGRESYNIMRWRKKGRDRGQGPTV